MVEKDRLRKLQSTLLFFILLTSLLFFDKKIAFAFNGELAAWTPSTVMNTVRNGVSTVATDKFVYAEGGFDGSNALSSVEMAPINSNGSLGAWILTAPMNTPRYDFATVIVGNYIYAIGGQNNSSIINTVEMAPINSDGTLGMWQYTNSLSNYRVALTAVTFNGYIYALGGVTNNGLGGNGGILNTVEMTSVNSDGTLGTWTPTTSMNEARDIFGATVVNNVIYTLGGEGNISETPDPASTVEKANIKSDGTLGMWQYTSTLVFPRMALGVTSMGNYIYALGGVYSGQNGNQDGNTVEFAMVNLDGSLSPWSFATSMTTPRYYLGTTTVQNKIYAIGGLNSPTPNGTYLNSTEWSGFPVAPTTLTPIADSYIKQGSQNENEGASTFLRLQQSGKNRALIKFDESQIQAAVGNSTNYTAQLKVAITDDGNNWGTTGRTIDMHRLTSDWVEGNGFIDGATIPTRGTGSGVTWNCAVDSIIFNFTNDCSASTTWNMDNTSLWPFITTPTATTTITNNQSGVVIFDVTSDVQAFLNGSSQNDGWIIKKTDEGQAGRINFGSKESTTPPQLIITRN